MLFQEMHLAFFRTIDLGIASGVDLASARDVCRLENDGYLVNVIESGSSCGNHPFSLQTFSDVDVFKIKAKRISVQTFNS